MCKEMGATVGCQNRGCKGNFHLRCAMLTHWDFRLQVPPPFRLQLTPMLTHLDFHLQPPLPPSSMQ